MAQRVVSMADRPSRVEREAEELRGVTVRGGQGRRRWDERTDGGCRTASAESNRTGEVQERPRRDYRRRKAELERKGRSSGDGSEELVAGGPMFLRPRF
ncbi:hypothetical protein ACHAO4_003239 [Trichoderma viride]